MSNIPQELKYTKTHEWVRIESDGSATVGITDHAQDALGDLVYVEPPQAGQSLAAGEACAVVESVKAASDIYAPTSGEVTAGNDALADAPEAINSDPYGEGWIFRFTPAEAGALESLLDADAYAAFLAEDGH